MPLLFVAGCGTLPTSEAQPGPGRGGPRGQEDGPVAVQTATAAAGELNGSLTYTGTTRPAQQVALRSQVSGEIIDLFVDVGDPVERGRVLAQLDGDLQTTDLNQAQAELSARQADTAQAEVSIRDAEASVVQAQATLDQARIDAQRLRSLADKGAISLQQAEAEELAATNAAQALRSAQAQVAAQRQAVASAANQIDAQRAVVAQSQKQLSYADLRSPLTGVVLSRLVDTGDFVASGASVLELGDLRTLEVTVQVSELAIAKLTVGQAARVTLDAFPGEGSLPGQISQIAPVADTTSRLIPVQVTLPNPNRRIGSGLLARVTFAPAQRGQSARVVVPASALAVGTEDNTVFIVEGSGDEAKAIARPVRIGEQNQDRVEILSGLAADDTFVVESDRPLTSGQAVRLSILSEQDS
ncbi:MAG: efflux RND transporter periplasmic adaptor subunit [Cyanobacteria bacterium J06559_1]